MAIEIGSLVVRGQFGGDAPKDTKRDETAAALKRMRAEILAEVRDMIEENERRRREG